MEGDSVGRDAAVSEAKLEKLRNALIKENEAEKASFRKVVKQQIQEKTKDTVIQVIKEKDNLVRYTVDKKKCMVIFGLQEKRNPVKMVREREEKKLVRNIVSLVQDEEQGMEREIEVYRIGKYKEEGKRPIKVMMRSQVVIEEILARTGKLAENHDYKNIWIKRDTNLEEREREKELRNEAKEKNEKRTETEMREYYWRVLDIRLRKWYIRQREKKTRGTQA